MCNSCLIKGCAYFGGTYGLQFQDWSSLEDGGWKFLWNSTFNQTSYSTRVHTVSVHLMSNGRMLGHAGQDNRGKRKGLEFTVPTRAIGTQGSKDQGMLCTWCYTWHAISCYMYLMYQLDSNRHVTCHHRIWVQKFKMNIFLILRERAPVWPWRPLNSGPKKTASNK
jgi:hypothetical protein